MRYRDSTRYFTGTRVGIKYDDFKKFYTNERKAKLDKINKDELN